MHRLDQFYTNPSLAVILAGEVVDRFGGGNNTLYVEPSAGTGAFLEVLKKRDLWFHALDVEPKAENIQQGDFLLPNSIFDDKAHKTIVLGNPPFGKNASLAVKFFNRAAEKADYIAFILPKTFRKQSIHSRLYTNFHLIEDRDVPENSFLKDGQIYDVPCCWQIWEKRYEKRLRKQPPSIDHIIEYTVPDYADFAVRRVGFYAGRVIRSDIKSLSKTTHYFMKEIEPGASQKIEATNWIDKISQTAGARSLSKYEIAMEFLKHEAS